MFAVMALQNLNEVTPNASVDSIIEHTLEQFCKPGVKPHAFQMACAQVVLRQEDYLMIQNTSAGKTFAALLAGVCRIKQYIDKSGEKNPVVVIISPTRQLMMDLHKQFKLLREGVSHLELVAETSVSLGAKKNLLKKNLYQFVSTTPETVQRFPKKFYALNDVVLMIVDEAHVVDEWGESFRATYSQLGALRFTMGSPPIIAMTATASDTQKCAIMESLGMFATAKVTNGSFDRPNVFIQCTQISFHKKALQHLQLVKFLEPQVLNFKNNDKSTIVIFQRKKLAQTLYRIINEQFKNDSKHVVLLDIGSASTPHRQWVSEKFQQRVPVFILATIGFCMGVDRSDISQVVMVGAPKSMSLLWQTLGRAGRDGRDAEFCLLWWSHDLDTTSKTIAKAKIKSKTLIQKEERELQVVKSWLWSLQCRRQGAMQALDASQEIKSETNRRCCDVCSGSSCTDVTPQIACFLALLTHAHAFYERIKDNVTIQQLIHAITTPSSSKWSAMIKPWRSVFVGTIQVLQKWHTQTQLLQLFKFLQQPPSVFVRPVTEASFVNDIEINEHGQDLCRLISFNHNKRTTLTPHFTSNSAVTYTIPVQAPKKVVDVITINNKPAIKGLCVHQLTCFRVVREDILRQNADDWPENSFIPLSFAVQMVLAGACTNEIAFMEAIPIFGFDVPCFSQEQRQQVFNALQKDINEHNKNKQKCTKC